MRRSKTIVALVRSFLKLLMKLHSLTIMITYFVCFAVDLCSLGGALLHPSPLRVLL